MVYPKYGYIETLYGVEFSEWLAIWEHARANGYESPLQYVEHLERLVKTYQVGE